MSEISQVLSNTDTLQQGKYQIQAVLGQGGFGITYLALHTTLGKKVAIKELFYLLLIFTALVKILHRARPSIHNLMQVVMQNFGASF